MDTEMDYTVIPHNGGWEGLAAVGTMLGAAIGVFLAGALLFWVSEKLRDATVAKKVLGYFGYTAVVAVMAAGVWGILTFSTGKIEETNTAAVETMKSNLSTKYVIDLDGFDVQSSSPAKGANTYTFRNKDAASVVKFAAEFDEHGEPFIVVNEHMTREDVENMLR